MSPAVMDASSVLVAFYAAADPRHAAVAERLMVGDALFAPAHLDVEVVSALRGLVRSNAVLEQTIPGALAHLAGFPIRRMPLPHYWNGSGSCGTTSRRMTPATSLWPSVSKQC
ncbi:type II toxin-antitoxin system VapC family toxin [Paeniglutamicibacter antarcticus]|uniref:Type II toxin-antitoxin system VapC family toxin n=1 Tax=Arthrobacter terrae TaxID=2935737 RepID=A0A931CNB8_9MICC|nr:type II toxin-antitoxin system VapC family toxin [Arthrobacter terrae]MBG0739340.1 type II toxin-antitoxin system VapC family toxin [Arthrobacter terrae]